MSERDESVENEPLTVRKDPSELDALASATVPLRPGGYSTTIRMPVPKLIDPLSGQTLLEVKKTEFTPDPDTARMPMGRPGLDGAKTVLDARLPPELQAALDAADRGGARAILGAGPAPPPPAPGVDPAADRNAARAMFLQTTPLAAVGGRTALGPFQPVTPPAVSAPRFQATLIDLNPPTEMQHEIEEAPATVRKPGTTQAPKDAGAPPSSEMRAASPPAGGAAGGGWDARSFGGAPRMPGSPQGGPPPAPPPPTYPQIAPIPGTPPPAAGRGYPPQTPVPAAPRKRANDTRFFAHDDDERWLDRYELITEIASGGMATVFLGRLQGAGGFQRLVAIKRLHANLAEDPEFVEMFIAEARIAAQIHHTHVVPLLEIGSSARGYYLVMEYIEGVTLGQLNQRVWQTELPVPRRIALRIMLDALAGLNAAHELTDEAGRLLGIVHRDCSPQNIIIGVDGTARLTDFGVARATTRLSNTRAGTIKGKVAYMAPEQIKRGQLDRRADLFAMGVILWEALAGRSLFRADTRLDTILQALNAPVPRLSEVTFGVPPELEDVCSKTLEREPEARFQSAVEMAEAIELAGRGAIASSREVASFLVKLFGRDFNERRASIRAWIEEVATAGPSGAAPRPPMPSVSAFGAPRASLPSYPMPQGYPGGYTAPLPPPTLPPPPLPHPGGGPYAAPLAPAVPAPFPPPGEVPMGASGGAGAQAGQRPDDPRYAPGPGPQPGQRPDDPRYAPGPGPQPGQRAEDPRYAQGPVAAQLPQDSQSAVTTTRQFVGSLTPIHLDSDEPIEIPMRGLVFPGTPATGKPSRVRPLLGRVLLAVSIALVAVIVAVVWFLRRPRPDTAPAAPSPTPTTLVSTQGGEFPPPVAVPTAPTPTLEPGETAAPTAETSGSAPSAKGSAASSKTGPVPSAKASGDELANPYR